MDDTKTGALERGEARRDAAHWSEQRPEFSGLRATSPGGWKSGRLRIFREGGKYIFLFPPKS